MLRPGRGARAVGDRAEVGHETGELGPAVPEDSLDIVRADPPGKPAEGLDDRGVGQRTVAKRDAAAHQDDTSLGLGKVDERADQSGLPDASLAGDQGRAAPTILRPAEGRPQPGEIGPTADQDGA